MRCKQEDLESIFVPLKCMQIFKITRIERGQNLTMPVGDRNLYLNLRLLRIAALYLSPLVPYEIVIDLLVWVV